MWKKNLQNGVQENLQNDVQENSQNDVQETIIRQYARKN